MAKKSSKSQKTKGKKAQVPDKAKMDALLKKQRKATPETTGKPVDTENLVRRYLYADGDALVVDNNNPDIIHGYWATSPSLACRKLVPNYVHRMDLTGYSYYTACNGSKEGIYLFTLAP